MTSPQLAVFSVRGAKAGATAAHRSEKSTRKGQRSEAQWPALEFSSAWPSCWSNGWSTGCLSITDEKNEALRVQTIRTDIRRSLSWCAHRSAPRGGGSRM